MSLPKSVMVAARVIRCEEKLKIKSKIKKSRIHDCIGYIYSPQLRLIASKSNRKLIFGLQCKVTNICPLKSIVLK
jgi:hypothetical protein